MIYWTLIKYTPNEIILSNIHYHYLENPNGLPFRDIKEIMDTNIYFPLNGKPLGILTRLILFENITYVKCCMWSIQLESKFKNH